ncbi:MAG: glycosyltransferase family 2 protein [Planctomycetota bacterium]
MSVVAWVVTVYAGIFCVVWCVIYLRAAHALLSPPSFEEKTPPEPAPWPRLSIVIAACNEADTIEDAMATLLKQDYPDLEIVLVDDRSTDGTGAIIDQMAQADPRIHPVHIKELPAGWLGKVHALHVAMQYAAGEWILFTDADVHFCEGMLRKAVAAAEAEGLDHLALLPRVRVDTFWLDVVMRAFAIMFFQTTRMAKIGKPGSDAFIGIGAFNLVRRSAFERTEGFPWLRMEVADDVGLGMMLQRSGGRPGFAFALDSLSVTWQPSVRAMFRCMERISYHSFPRLIGSCVFIWAMFFAPVAAILSGVPWLWFPAIAAGSATVAMALAWRSRLGHVRPRVLPSLLIPVGMMILSIMVLRAVILCKIRGGIVWRGTKYSIDELRAGRRVVL